MGRVVSIAVIPRSQVQGRPFVVVINPEDCERMLQDREADFAVLDEVWAKNPDVDPEEAEADAAREIAAYRQERRGKAKEQRSA